MSDLHPKWCKAKVNMYMASQDKSPYEKFSFACISGPFFLCFSLKQRRADANILGDDMFYIFINVR